MSKKVDLDKPLSERDIEYLISRDQHQVVAFNAVAHGNKLSDEVATSIRARGITPEEVRRAVNNARGIVSEETEEDEENQAPEKFSDEWFAKAKVAELQHELKERKLPTTGRRDELVARLEESVLEDEDDEDEDEDDDEDEETS